jgi:hypothetical protein
MNKEVVSPQKNKGDDNKFDSDIFNAFMSLGIDILSQFRMSKEFPIICVKERTKNIKH